MGESLRQSLMTELAGLEAQSLRRRLTALPGAGRTVEVDGRELLNCSSNDYLGLSQHPHLKQAVIDAAQRYGVGSGASRLVCGHLDIHEQVEQRFAAFKHAEAALLFPTGYMANLAVLTTLAGADDLVLLDKLSHASLIDAARASGATVRTFRHRDYNHLEKLLQRPSAIRHPPSAIFLVTDAIFSMDGDTADLPTICDIAQRYDATVIVDEAHATGVLGDTGAGLCELQGVTGRVDIIVSTASKALGCLGGIVTGSRPIIDTLINKARPFIYTTAVPPTQAAAIDAALDVVRDESRRRQRLMEMSQRMRAAIPNAPPNPSAIRHPPSAIATPIIPLITGAADSAIALAKHLRASGIGCVAIRPPTVPPNTSRVRISLRCDLEDADVDRLIDAVHAWPRVTPQPVDQPTAMAASRSLIPDP